MTLTTSLLAAPPVALRLGVQEPRIKWVPPYVSSAGEDAIGAYELTGRSLNPWQKGVLIDSLGERADRRWAAFEVGLVVARQNGKDEILIATELAGLFMWGERLIIHSAHKFDTAMEHLERLAELIDDVPEFRRRVRKVNRSHGQEGITLRDGARIRFRARTRSGGGRGYTGDRVIFNEAMDLPDALVGSIMPTMSARSMLVPGPQIWLAGSAVDQETMANGIVLARVREAGIAGSNDRLGYFEYSAKDDVDPADWLARAQANPSLGYQISAEHIETEFRSPSMSARQFAVERLGIGDWPDTADEAEAVIPQNVWVTCGCADESQTIVGGKTFAIDVSPDRAWGCISVAGRRGDDLVHVAVVAHERSTDWIIHQVGEDEWAGAAVDLADAHPGCRFVVHTRGPAASLIPALKAGGLTVLEATTSDYADACAVFFDAAVHRRMRYPVPQPELTAAVAAARKTNPEDGAWKWSRKNSTAADITPLVSGSLAVWAVESVPEQGALRPLVAFR